MSHPLYESRLDVTIAQDDNATVAVVTTPWGSYATGSAKRAPGDEKDYARASRLATARAMIRLGRVILKSEKATVYPHG